MKTTEFARWRYDFTETRGVLHTETKAVSRDETFGDLEAVLGNREPTRNPSSKAHAAIDWIFQKIAEVI
jgi:hypothetical protein